MDLREKAVTVMLEACDNNDLSTAKTIQIQFKLDSIAVLDFDDDDIADSLIEACRNGHLDIAQWITETFKSICEYEYTQCKAIIEACKGKHFEVATWLVDTFLLPECILTASNSRIVATMLEACGNGDLNTAKRIRKQFEQYFSGSDYEAVFIVACQNGHLEIAQWITETFREDIYDTALIEACRSKHFEVVTWLINTFYG